MATSTLMKIEEAARLLGVSVNTLRYWRHIDYGPRTAKFGRRIVYREADIRSWIDAQFDSPEAS